MTRILMTAGAIALGLAVTATQTSAGSLDRLEDRIDRRESVIDRQTDNGRLDRIEDRIDRRESIADRRGRDFTPRINRHERRSWRRLWRNHQS
jgi:phage shock protein A